jgi:hypothetical protein
VGRICHSKCVSVDLHVTSILKLYQVSFLNDQNKFLKNGLHVIVCIGWYDFALNTNMSRYL